MLSKKQRLHTLEYKNLRENFTQKKTGKYFSVSFHKTEEESKAAAIVGKKAYALATKRNHLRRQVYSVLREYFPLPKNTLLIIRALPSSKNISKKELEADLRQLLTDLQ